MLFSDTPLGLAHLLGIAALAFAHSAWRMAHADFYQPIMVNVHYKLIPALQGLDLSPYRGKARQEVGVTAET